MARRRAVFKTQGRKRVNGVVVAGSSYHHIATHDSAGFLSAPEFVIAPGFPRPICSSASGPWPSFLVRSLHYLSASADSQDSPATDRTGKARSSDQRECGAHHRSRGFGRPQKFSTVSLIRRYWDIRLKNFRSHPSSSRFIPKTVGGSRMLPRKPAGRGREQFWNIVSVTRMAIGWFWNPLQASCATKTASRKNL